MTKKALTPETQRHVQEAVFRKADQHGYATQGRIENGRFMDDLVDDPEIGVILREYMDSARVRTYIKDGVLNAYAKKKIKDILQAYNPMQIICDIYSVSEAFVEHQGNIAVCYNSNERVFVISKGTVLKWETALRRALEFIARSPKLRVEGNYPSICLQLAVINGNITEGDKKQITNALAAVGVKVFFCLA